MIIKMDNSLKFKKLREKYQYFIYKDYNIKEDENEIFLTYTFEIPDLAIFNPSIKILKKDMKIRKLETDKIKNMIFHIGLIELISYWKCTCSPNVIIKCGDLNEEQKKWLKKLYFYGLGELFFTNNIKTDIESFMNIECEGNKIEIQEEKDILERIYSTNRWRKRLSCNT